MIDVSSDLRLSYLNSINNIEIDGNIVPVYDEHLPVNAPTVTIEGAECYVLVTDQSETEGLGTMCYDLENANITLQVITKYPKGSGGKRLSERISNHIQDAVKNSFISSLNVKRITKIISQSQVENTEAEISFIKNIIYQNDIKL